MSTRLALLLVVTIYILFNNVSFVTYNRLSSNYQLYSQLVSQSRVHGRTASYFIEHYIAFSAISQAPGLLKVITDALKHLSVRVRLTSYSQLYSLVQQTQCRFCRVAVLILHVCRSIYTRAHRCLSGAYSIDARALRTNATLSRPALLYAHPESMHAHLN